MLALAHVGQVRDHQVEAAGGNRPVGELHPITEAEALAVGLRDGQRVERGVGGRDPSRRQLVGDRESDRARPGADVEHRPRAPLERHLDQQLGFRAGDQHAAVDRELQPPEALAPEDVGDGLAAGAASHHLPERTGGAGVDPSLRLGREPGTVQAGGCAEHQLRIQPRALDPRSGKRVGGRRERLADGACRRRRHGAPDPDVTAAIIPPRRSVPRAGRVSPRRPAPRRTRSGHLPRPRRGCAR